MTVGVGLPRLLVREVVGEFGLLKCTFRTQLRRHALISWHFCDHDVFATEARGLTVIVGLHRYN